MTTKREHIATIDTLGIPTLTRTYTYNTNTTLLWADQLRTYNGFGTATIAYDRMGNPTSGYNGFTMTWEKGRQLSAMARAGVNARNLAFQYNANGIRTRKTNATTSTTHNYFLQGANIQIENITSGNTVNTIQYIYDDNGDICGLSYNGNPHYFVKNLQGDVIKLLDRDGNLVAKYGYDSWGKIIYIRDGNNNNNIVPTATTHIANINPIRYRSYYYDTETMLYYLNSRYYDPETGRFLNADDPHMVLAVQGVVGNNLYAYCNNDPVNSDDPLGYLVLTKTAVLGILALAFLIMMSIMTIQISGVRFTGPRLVLNNTNVRRRLQDLQAFGAHILMMSSFIVAIATQALRDARRRRRNRQTHNHHIIARFAPAAQPARDVLTSVGMSTENRLNLVRIKKNLHIELHRNSFYYGVINSIFENSHGNLARVTRKLNFISSVLSATSFLST